MDFFKKWLRNHQKFLLHFLIHIDVLKLCSNFELIQTSIFRVTAILRKHQKSRKYLKAIIHGATLLHATRCMQHVAPCMIPYFVACNMLHQVDNHSTWCNMLHATCCMQQCCTVYDSLKAIAHGFFQKMAPKSPKIFITFSYTY